VVLFVALGDETPLEGSALRCLEVALSGLGFDSGAEFFGVYENEWTAVAGGTHFAREVFREPALQVACDAGIEPGVLYASEDIEPVQRRGTLQAQGGGGSGIRTHEGAFTPYPLSRRAHSATMRSLRKP
jgi:hypothetical protein